MIWDSLLLILQRKNDKELCQIQNIEVNRTINPHYTLI